jgi:hypothetical protein
MYAHIFLLGSGALTVGNIYKFSIAPDPNVPETGRKTPTGKQVPEATIKKCIFYACKQFFRFLDGF